MKKVFKTLLAAILAVVMSVTLFAFAGCGDEDNKDGNDKNNGGTTQVSNEDKLLATEYSALELEATVGIGDEGEYDVAAKVNLDGNADISVKALGKGENAGDDFFMYFFMRGWKVYGTFTEAEETDFSAAELEGFVDINQVLESVLGGTGVELPENIASKLELDKAVDEVLDLVNYLVLNLGKAANAVTEANNSLTVDLNKLMFNAVTDIKGVVNGLTNDTTVGQILANENLKKYVKVITELVTPEELVATLVEAIDGAAGGEGVPAEATAIIAQVKTLLNTVKPDANSSTYDYIVKLVGSQELVNLINQAMGAPEGTGLTKKLTEFKVSELLALADKEELTLDSLKTMVNQYASIVTATALTFGEDSKAEALKVVYAYEGDYSLKSMAFTGKITIEGMLMDIDATLTFNKTAFTGFATLPAQLPEIEDFEIDKEPAYPEENGSVVVG